MSWQISLHLCHFCSCRFAWKTGKPKKFVISFPLPFCVYIWNSAWQIVKAGMSSRTRGRIGRTKWRRKCTQSSTNFKASRRFPGLSYILIATAKKKMAMWNVNDISCARDWTQVCYIFPTYLTLEISTRVIYCRGQEVSEIFITFFCLLNLMLGVMRRGVRRGSPWTGPYVVHGPGT